MEGLTFKWAFAKKRKRALKQTIAVLINMYWSLITPQNLIIRKSYRVLKCDNIKKMKFVKLWYSVVCQDILKEKHPNGLLAKN